MYASQALTPSARSLRDLCVEVFLATKRSEALPGSGNSLCFFQGRQDREPGLAFQRKPECVRRQKGSENVIAPLRIQPTKLGQGQSRFARCLVTSFGRVRALNAEGFQNLYGATCAEGSKSVGRCTADQPVGRLRTKPECPLVSRRSCSRLHPRSRIPGCGGWMGGWGQSSGTLRRQVWVILEMGRGRASPR